METNQTNIVPPQPTPNVQQPVSNPVQNPVPVQPQTFSAPEQPKGSKWRLILIILLILSIFSFGGYYLVLPKMGINILPTPTPTPTITTLPSPTPDQTANWKTYTNTDYGFLIKYPLDLIPKTEEDVPSLVKVAFYPDNPQAINFPPFLTVKVTKTQNLEQDVERIKKELIDSGFADRIINEDIIIMAGCKAIRINYDSSNYQKQKNGIDCTYRGAPNCLNSLVVFSNEKYNYRIATDISSFDQILSTFKFTQ